MENNRRVKASRRRAKRWGVYHLANGGGRHFCRKKKSKALAIIRRVKQLDVNVLCSALWLPPQRLKKKRSSLWDFLEEDP